MTCISQNIRHIHDLVLLSIKVEVIFFRGVNHPPQSSAEVEERVQLCLYISTAFKAAYRVICNFTRSI